jgi:hypothetical protein
MTVRETYADPRVSRPTIVQLPVEDIEQIATLMRELRDTTLSRRTFAAATLFLRRYAGETDSPTLVCDDPSNR